MYQTRTDLALERHGRLGSVPPSMPGLEVQKTCEGDLEITHISVSSEKAAEALG